MNYSYFFVFIAKKDLKDITNNSIRGDKMKKSKNKENKKNEGNNQWTNNNLKYYPDERERKDGPGGEGLSSKKEEN